jgi:hypothetical protein
MSRNLGLEIAEARPVETLIEIHFGDGDGSPVLGASQFLAAAGRAAAA